MSHPEPAPPGPPPFPEGLRRRYEPASRLGEGSYSLVLKARQKNLGRAVVLKLLRWGEQLRESDVLRFLAEARILAGLRHRHVLAMLDHGVEDGVAYIVYPDEGGISLLEHLKARGREPLAVVEIGRILDEILQGLQHVHSRGVIHRDLKPANLLVARDSSLRIFDFGLAKSLEASRSLTRTDTILGTPAYMAPEQIRGLAPDPRDDLYSLGVIAYELTTGTNPFGAPSIADTLSGHFHLNPEPLCRLRPDCPEGLADLVSDLLAKRREERPESALEALDRLRAIFRGKSGTRPLPPLDLALASGDSLAQGRPGRVPPGALAGLAGLLATAFGLALQAWPEHPSTRSPDPAASAERYPVPSDLDRLAADLAAVPPRVATTQPEDPLAWPQVLAASPALQDFERWVRDGGLPDQGLPAATAARMRDMDRELGEQRLPAIFMPYARARPEAGPWQVPAGSRLVVPGLADAGFSLDGWLGAAGRAAEEALAEVEVLNASAAPEGEEADREVVPSRLRGVVLTMSRSLELIHDSRDRFAYMAPEIWAWGAEGRALLDRWAGRAIDATGRMSLDLGLAIRHRPDQAETAALLFWAWLTVLKGFTYSGVTCRDPDFVLGGPPGSPAGFAARAILLDRAARVQTHSPRGEGLVVPPSAPDWEAVLSPATGPRLVALATGQLLTQALAGHAPGTFPALFRTRLAASLVQDPARRRECLAILVERLEADHDPTRVEPLARELLAILEAEGLGDEARTAGLARLAGGTRASPGSP